MAPSESKRAALPVDPSAEHPAFALNTEHEVGALGGPAGLSQLPDHTGGGPRERLCEQDALFVGEPWTRDR